MLDIKIRPYISSDYGCICKIHDDSRKIELSLASLDDAFLPFSFAAEREDFFGYLHIDVAVVDGNVVAFSAYNHEELAWLYVSPKWMRKGIARKLVERALLIEPKIKYIEALRGNEPARNLYESFGFRVKEIVKGSMPGNESFIVEVYSMHRD